jgi:hypothetical protein
VGEGRCLLGGAALGVNGDAGRADGAAVGEPGRAGDVHALSSQLVDTAADDLVHLIRGQALTREQLAHHVAQGVGGVGTGQLAHLAADRGAGGIDDHDFGHGECSRNGFVRSPQG